MLRQMGNCPPQVRTKAAPPHALEQAEPLRPCVLSWNAGHLGQQQWSEVKSWLTTEATQTCDIVVLQETHWQATAEFNAAGWYCVSSASPDDAPPAGKGKNKRGGTAHLTTVEARPDDAGSVPAKSRPSVTRADGVMVLLSPRIPAKSVRWKEHVVGRALEVRFDWQGARTTVVAVYQHVWSPAKTIHNNRQDRASVLKALSRCVKQAPHRDTLLLAGDFSSSLTRQPRLIGPAAASPQEKRPDEPELSNFLSNHRLNSGSQHVAHP